MGYRRRNGIYPDGPNEKPGDQRPQAGQADNGTRQPKHRQKTGTVLNICSLF